MENKESLMCGSSMALRYDDRGSHFSKPCYNGSGGGNSGSNNVKDRGWNHNNSGNRGRYYGGSRSNAFPYDHERKSEYRANDQMDTRNGDAWDDRSNISDTERSSSRQVGDWTEHVSKGGKRYYYNCRTEVSQWEKPTEWLAWEKRIGENESRKRRNDRQRLDETTASPSHSSLGRPSSSRDITDDAQWNNRGCYNGDRTDATGSNARRTHGRDDRRYHNDGVGGGGGSTAAGTQNVYSSGRGGGDYYSKRHHESARNDNFQSAGLSEKPSTSTNNRSRAKRPCGSSGAELSENKTHSTERSPKRLRTDEPEKSITNSDSRSVDRVAPEHSMTNGGTCAEVDMQRLPELLVEIADKNGIDLSDPEALDKIKQHLKTALCKELASAETPVKNGVNSQTLAAVAVSDDEEDASNAGKQLHATADEIEMDTVKEEEKKIVPIVDTLSEVVQQSRLLYNDELTAHVKGWSAEHFEHRAAQLSESAFIHSLDAARVTADLKCARSLVRTAEIRSTLLEQRIGYLREQYNQLEIMNKPSSGASYAVSSAGATT